MDYSNFIRNLYRIATNELKKYKNYYGKIVHLTKPLEVPSEFLHTEESDSLFMPQEALNIDAPTKYFLDFMEYYIELMPNLSIVFADRNRILELYNNTFVKNNIVENEDKVYSYIESLVKVGISTLVENGILEQ